MSDASIKEQLMFLKATTVRTGAVHEAQKLQMTGWSMLFPKADRKKTKVKVSPTKRLVEYDVVAPGMKVDKFVKKLVIHIDEWTKYLLWNDSAVVIKANGQVIYDSRSTKE